MECGLKVICLRGMEDLVEVVVEFGDLVMEAAADLFAHQTAARGTDD
jgi:hypothetical protein